MTGGPMTSRPMRAVGITHPGLRRPVNQDRLVLDGRVVGSSSPGPQPVAWDAPALFAVCDGMGGHPGGEIAASIAADTLASGARSCTSPDQVRVLVEAANDQVYRSMARHPGLAGMGSTVAGLVVTDDALTIFNVGDSRVYLWVDGHLVQASLDDRAGTGSTITQSLGGMVTPSPVEVHVATEPRSFARALVATDGVFGEVDRDRLETAMRAPIDEAAAHLVQLALDAGGSDNITAVVVDLTEETT